MRRPLNTSASSARAEPSDWATINMYWMSVLLPRTVDAGEDGQRYQFRRYLFADGFEVADRHQLLIIVPCHSRQWTQPLDQQSDRTTFP